MAKSSGSKTKGGTARAKSSSGRSTKSKKDTAAARASSGASNTPSNDGLDMADRASSLVMPPDPYPRASNDVPTLEPPLVASDAPSTGPMPAVPLDDGWGDALAAAPALPVKPL